jgi:4-nitrophenyl phosphatase
LPIERGAIPGAGALLAVISSATGVQPFVIGKPGPALFDEAVRRLEGSLENTAMVGDRLGTDIAGAKKAGLTAILLLSGISTIQDVQESEIEADYVFADINELASQLEAAYS